MTHWFKKLTYNGMVWYYDQIFIPNIDNEVILTIGDSNSRIVTAVIPKEIYEQCTKENN